MTAGRMIRILRISMKKNGFQRAEYLKKKNVFASIGERCFWQPRNIPPEAKLIKLGDNVVIASEVLFVNHDVMHHVFRNLDGGNYRLHLGAIEIGNNVFLGSRCTVLPGTKIGDNVIVGAGAVITGELESGGVYAGVPAKRIGDFETVLESRKLPEPDRRPKAERFGEEWEAFSKKYGE